MGRASAPAAGDLRRLLAWFVGLVVLPVFGLVGFGVLAIFNERGAVERRFQEGYGGRLRALAASLEKAVDEEARALREHRPPVDTRRIAYRFRLAEGRLSTTTEMAADARSAVASALAGRSPVDAAPLVTTIDDGPAAGLYVLVVEEDGLRGLAFSEAGLSHELEDLARSRFVDEEGRFVLRRAGRDRSWSEQLVDEGRLPEDTFDPLSLRLPAPFGGWMVRAELGDADPIRSVLWRNRAISIGALVLFYVVITAGIVVTVRGIARQTRLSRMRTDFVSTLSHELRTPLASIRMFAETLTLGRAAGEEERRFCAETILRETERLSRITERTLDWARLEAGRKAYVRTPMDLGALVRETAAAFVTLARLPDGVLTVEVDDALPPVLADADALGQVVLNLVENAAKYTGEADRRIDVSVRARGRWVVLSVKDNGVGIARRDQRRIFDRFYRADDLLSRRTEGTGLGLSIAKIVVEQHGGRIGVDSAPGAGSTFTVRLPRAPAHATGRAA
ncbi:MAG: sensor histidine kinase [Pseudomonadota bacterium]|jgi:signal transduction histidine kinase